MGMTTRLSNHIRGVLKISFGLLPGATRGLPFDRKVEVLLEGRSDVAPIVRPMLVAWRQLHLQIAAFDKQSAQWCECRWGVAPSDEYVKPGVGLLSALAYVSTASKICRVLPDHRSGRRAPWAHAPRQYQSGEVDRSGRDIQSAATP